MAKSDVPVDAKLVGNRFSLAIKDLGTAFEKLKARWIVQGHQDKQKQNISNNAPALMRFSLLLAVEISVIYFDCALFTRDIEQAHIQSKPLSRPVYTYAPPQANLPDGYLLRINLPHCGLVESASCWFDTYYPT